MHYRLRFNLLVLLFSFAASTLFAVGPHPNVLLILTDDQGYGDVHSHGNEKIDTPIHDRLADEGARFDRFYVSPVCAPTRASLMTGRYALRAGVHDVTRAGETMRSEEVTIAEVMKQNGYATGCFGKWHNGAHYPENPNGQGFDEFLGFCAGHWNNYFDTQLEHNGKLIRTKGYMEDVLTDAAMNFIRKNKDQSWFCYVPLNIPHSPFQVPDKYFDKYKARGFDDTLSCVYGMVENIDDNMGRMLKLLDELSLSKDTIVIYMSDNGANTDRYNAGMKGRKGSLHEGGSRVPFFIRWPGKIAPGQIIKPIAAHIDILPTLVDFCGLPKPKTLPLDGRSLVPLLTGKATSWPDDRILFNHWGGILPTRGSVRTQKWRLVKERKVWELYNMQDDPDETKNIAAQNPDVVKTLSADFDKWFADVSSKGFDVVPTKIGYPASSEVILPGHEALLAPEKGDGISYNGRAGWANDWVCNWTSTDSYPAWPVEVVTAGRYEITLLYACPKKDVGSRIRVEIGDQSLETIIGRAHDPKTIPSPDRVPRKEVYEKVWALQRVGVVDLKPGKTELAVKAIKIAGSQVMELKGVRIRQLN